jgi:hypothetical protein
MNDFQPELGQMAFGQPWQSHEVPEIMEAALGAIRDEYDRVYWNVNQKDCPSPFGNSGPEANLKTDVLEVCAYSWSDDEQPYNFAWRDLRISWYKYAGRGMSANMKITPDMAAQCLTECLESIRKLDTPSFGE